METTNYIALSRQAAMRREMALVANNMANTETPGYRAERMMFTEYLAETQRGETGSMSFVQDIGTVRDLQPGSMRRTDNPLDLAIDGDAYFSVETEAGERFTRRGDFQLDGGGRIVTAAGDALLDANDNPIVVPEDAAEIRVTPDGTLATEAGEIARLKLSVFDNQQDLMKRRGSLYEAREDQQPAEAAEARVMQGMLEGSNVQGVLEMTRLIDITRSYSSAGKFAESEHERILRAVRSLVSSN